MNIKIIALCLLLMPSSTFPMSGLVLTLFSFVRTAVIRTQQKKVIVKKEEEPKNKKEDEKKESEQSWSYWDTLVPWLTMGYCDPRESRKKEINNIQTNIANSLEDIISMETLQDPKFETNFTKLKEVLTSSKGKVNLNDPLCFGYTYGYPLIYILKKKKSNGCDPIRLSIVKFLIEQGANNFDQLSSALSWALNMIDISLVQYLLKQTALCGKLDKLYNEESPLRYVLTWNFKNTFVEENTLKKMVDLLIKNGASFSWFNDERSWTRENILKNCEKLSIANLLLMNFLQKLKKSKYDKEQIFHFTLRYGDDKVLMCAIEKKIINVSDILTDEGKSYSFLSLIIDNKKDNIEGILRFCKKKYPDIFTGPYSDGNNLLLQACHNRYNGKSLYNFIFSLLKLQPDLAQQINKNGKSAISLLMHSFSIDEHQDFVKNIIMLLDHNCPFPSDNYENTPIHHCIYKGVPSGLAGFFVGLPKKTNPNEINGIFTQPNKDRLTPLQLAKVLGHNPSINHSSDKDKSKTCKSIIKRALGKPYKDNGAAREIDKAEELLKQYLYDKKQIEPREKLNQGKFLYDIKLSCVSCE
jgi:hypothetical protein